MGIFFFCSGKYEQDDDRILLVLENVNSDMIARN